MPIYKITLVLRSEGPPYQNATRLVFREYPSADLDAVWHKLLLKSEEKWGRDLKDFDCVMISKRSPQYRNFLKDQAHQKGPTSFLSVQGKRNHPPASSGKAFGGSNDDSKYSF